MPETEYLTFTAPSAVLPSTDTSKWPVAPSATVPPEGAESDTLSVSDAAGAWGPAAFAEPAPTARANEAARIGRIRATVTGRAELRVIGIRVWAGRRGPKKVMAQGCPFHGEMMGGVMARSGREKAQQATANPR